MLERVDFCEALRGLKVGSSYARKAWKGNRFVFSMHGDALKQAVHESYGDVYSEAYDVQHMLWEMTESDELVAYTPSHEDLFAEDWYQVGVVDA